MGRKSFAVAQGPGGSIRLRRCLVPFFLWFGLLLQPGFGLAGELDILPVRNSYLTPMLGAGRAYTGLESGPDWSRERENRAYTRTPVTASPARAFGLPLNTTYDIEDSFAQFGVRSFSRMGFGLDSQVSADVHARLPIRSRSTYAVYSNPATSANGRTITQSFSDVEADAKRYSGYFGIEYVGRIAAGSEITVGFTYKSDYFHRGWKYQFIRNDTDGTQNADRNESFDLTNQNCERALIFRYRYLSPQMQVVPRTLDRDLDFVKPPLMVSAAFFLEGAAGGRWVDNRQDRDFRYIDSLWPGVPGWGCPEFIFFQEEDYSNNPRAVRDRYQQGILGLKGYLGTGPGAMLGVEARYELPVTWERDLKHLDGPYVWNLFPSYPRVFSNQDDYAGKQAWSIKVDRTTRINQFFELTSRTALKGRRDKYYSAYNTNWTWGGGAPWFNPGRESLEENIREDVYESSIGCVALCGPSRGPSPSVLDFQDRPMLVSGQALIHPVAGYRRVKYHKSFNYFYAVVGAGPAWMGIDMNYNQFFMELNSALGVSSNSMLVLNVAWDLPARFNHPAPYQWDYRYYVPSSTDYSTPSAGVIEGSVSKVKVSGECIYRPTNDLQLQLELNYQSINTTANYEAGPYFTPVNGYLDSSDRYDAGKYTSTFGALAGVRRLF